ncbi:MAG: helix-hairpin-helix domain-containing protein [Trueperaceae bacterium]
MPRTDRSGTANANATVASRLDEVGLLLEEQRANPFRVNAYRRAAATIRELERPLAAILDEGGLEGLEKLPTIGERLARSIRTLVTTGRLPLLEHLRGDADPEVALMTVPGIGPKLADRLVHELGIGSLEDLEAAAHDGRLEGIDGLGPKRIAGIRDVLRARLGRVRPLPVDAGDEPSVAEILDVDREYREAAARGRLPTIAPRRFNPTGEAWLPILHTRRGDREFTAMFSNTARAHRLGRTDDWVVIYHDGRGGERQATVVTAGRGALQGRRVVRGREEACAATYGIGAERTR